MANPPARDVAIKKWKEFLLDPKYNFRYIVGDSGTCYVGNDYFADVIYRFSLRDSIEKKFVKTIDYVAEDVSHATPEKFQKIYDNHIQNKSIKYRLIKPLTILVTKDIKRCKELTDDLINFIADKEGISRDAASNKVLIVTSANEHKNNIPKLKDVDNRDNPIEWITSVSMLSEGWDVKNVCQIVPHEERAFNSKLLIAQVLGRGLRVPPEYKGEQPAVTVFNHDRWSSNIKHLVNEVLEIEKRIHSYIIPKEKDYNFELHGIRYDKEPVTMEAPMEKPYELLKKGFISLSSEDQTQRIEEKTIYERAVTEDRREKSTLIEFDVYTAEEIAQIVHNRYKSWDMDESTNYAQEHPLDKILPIIRNSLEQRENLINEKGRQRILQAFGVIKRKKSKSLRYKVEAENIFKINTSDIKRSSLGIGALRRDSSIFYDHYSVSNSDEKDRKLLKELLDDENLPRYALQRVENAFNFKTPLNIAFASYKPERDFIKRLVREENAKKIDDWIKSPDVGFYSLEYSWQKGTHPKQGSFNPDFFIKIGNDVLVVEIKADEDISSENRAKLKYAREHFNRVNNLQSEYRYYFKFLSPQSYDLFFQYLREGQYRDFKSEIEANLEVEIIINRTAGKQREETT